jgi:hypothetical protein
VFCLRRWWSIVFWGCSYTFYSSLLLFELRIYPVRRVRFGGSAIRFLILFIIHSFYHKIWSEFCCYLWIGWNRRLHSAVLRELIDPYEVGSHRHNCKLNSTVIWSYANIIWPIFVSIFCEVFLSLEFLVTFLFLCLAVLCLMSFTYLFHCLQVCCWISWLKEHIRVIYPIVICCIINQYQNHQSLCHRNMLNQFLQIILKESI